jgi:group I intron endonuclease
VPDSIYYIYRLTNIHIKTPKSYIGFTSQTLEKRFGEHCYQAVNKLDFVENKRGRVLCKALRKYGAKAFKKEYLYCSKDLKHTLNVMEEYFIRLYQTHFINGFGYNMTYGGEGTPGHFVPQELKDKLRLLKKGVPLSLGHKANIVRSLIGRHHSEETKNKIKENNIGKNKGKESNVLQWYITYPNGHQIQIFNLSKFCRDNHLDQSAMIRVSTRQRTHHKGFKCSRVVL